MRLIDADALKMMRFVAPKHKEPEVEAYMMGWNDAVDAIIENAPTIKAEPVKHGRCNTCRYMTKDELCTRYEDENGTHSTMPEGYCWLWERRMDEVTE